MPALLNPTAGSVLSRASATRVEAIDALERSIATTIRDWRPGSKASALAVHKVELVRFRGHPPSSPGAEVPRLEFDVVLTQEDATNPIDDALQQASKANLDALQEQSGLPISALNLLQAWMDMSVEARVLKQQLEVERAASLLQASADDARQRVHAADPTELLPAPDMGKALGGLSDETVRQREKAGELFSILRPGRKRGREYPAFQAWPGVGGAPLQKVLAKLRAWPTITGADTYGFFSTPTELLGGLTPIEALIGALSPSARPVGDGARNLLAAPDESRLDAVLQAAEAFIAQVAE